MDGHKTRRMNRILSGVLAGLMLIGTFVGTDAISMNARAADTPTATITLDEAEHGSIAFADSKETVLEKKVGETVSIQATPEDGYELDSLLAVDESGQATPLTVSEYIATLTVDKPIRIVGIFDEVDTSHNANEEAFAILEPEPVQARSEMQTSEDYILEHMDRSKVGDGDELSILDVMQVTTTVTDHAKYADATFDDLWKDLDGDGYAEEGEAPLIQDSIYIPLYSVSDESEYFVGQAVSLSPVFAVNDWQGAENSPEAVLFDDIQFDEETGLVYVPKARQLKEDGKTFVGSTRLQVLLTATSEDTIAVPVFVNQKGVKGTLLADGVADASILSVKTRIQLALDEKALDKIKADTIDSVELNGMVFEQNDRIWEYEEETGILTIYIAPISLTEVSINLSETLGKDVGRFFDGAKTFFGNLFSVNADASTVPGVIKFREQPKVGDRFNVSASVIHDDRGDAVDRDGLEFVAQGYIRGMTPASFLSGGNENEAIMSNIVNNVNMDGVEMVEFYRDIRRLVHISAQTNAGANVEVPSMDLLLQCAHARVPFTFDGVDFNDNANGAGWGNDAWIGGITGAINQTVNITVASVRGNSLIISVLSPRGKSQTGVGYFEVAYELDGGQVQLQKFSANPTCTNGNPAYSMTGAKYGIFSDSGCTQKVAELTVQNEDGLTNTSDRLPAGTYYIKELANTQTRGYKINEKVRPFNVEPGKTTLIAMDGQYAEEPLNDPVSVWAQKSIGNADVAGKPQGNITSLAGIKFRVDWYPGLYESAAEAQASGNPGASAIFETQDVVMEDQTVLGVLLFNSAKPVDGTTWPFIKASGANYAPLGTIVITEVSTLEGLVLRGQGSVLQIVANEQGGVQCIPKEGWSTQSAPGANLGSFEASIHNEEVSTDLIIYKIDEDRNAPLPQGDATLVGVEYEVINKSQTNVTYNGVDVPVGGVVTTVRTEQVGNKVLATVPDLLNGTYQVREKAASTGYQNPQWTSETFTLPQDATNGTYEVKQPNSNPVQRGGLLVVKRDADTKHSMPQGDGDLTGAQFDVFNASDALVVVDGINYEPGAKVATIETTWDGVEQRYAARLDNLPYGRYRITESGAPEGYHKANFEATMFVDGQGVVVATPNPCDENIYRSGEVKVVKADADWRESHPQGDASLAGVQYELINRSKYGVYVGGTVYAPGEVITTLTTAWSDDDQAYTASTSGLPYGTYELKETKASTGYNNANWTQTFTIREDGQSVFFDTADHNWNENDVMRGGVVVGKMDRETSQYLPLGEAHLDGAVFSITNRSNESVVVNGTTYAVGDEVMRIASEAIEWNGATIYAATTGEKALPYGTYEIREIASGTGYLFDSESQAYTKTIQIREDGEMIDLTSEDDVVKNQVIREDWHFKKKAEDTMERLEGIPFLVESLTTGERHILVTDENGTWGSAWVPHTTRTNENDPTSPISNGAVAVDETGEWVVADSSKLNCDAGIWFTGRPEEEVTWGEDGTTYTIGTKTLSVQDGKRAFPYDTYRVQELRCENNENYGLVSFTVTMHRYGNPDGEGLDIDYGTIDDRKISIGTTLSVNEDACFGDLDSEITLTDVVTYDNVAIGTHYTLKGEIHGVNKDGTDAGVIATVEVPFTPTERSGRTEVEFKVPAKAFTTPSVVAFEYLMIGDSVMASHEDLADENQTVKVPQIGTTLTGDLDHMANAGADEIVLTDVIAYEGFVPGKEYVATGTLMDKETGEAVLDGDGNPITSTTTFAPEEADGTVTVTFRFAGQDLVGKTVVAFEEVTRDGKLYAAHADLEDEGQSVTFPEVDSYAADESDSNKDLAAAPGQTVKEVVSVSGLKAGYEYKLVGTLHVREDGADLGATSYQVEALFDAESPVQTMLFTDVDATELGGKQLVVFQMLYGRANEESDWVLLSDNGADITDDDESVRIPVIGTTLTGQNLHEMQVPEDGMVTLTDTVSFKNLTPGHTYAVFGELHTPEMGEDGQIVGSEPVSGATAGAIFTPESSDGTVDLTFTFDASDLVGTNVTAFETLYSSPNEDVPDDWKEHFEGDEDVPEMEKPEDGWKVADHADITDEGQTVHFVDFGTTLTSDEGTQETEAAGTMTLVDTVAYTNLIPGHTYEVSGTLHLKIRDEDGNLVDGGAVTDKEGNEVTGKVTFVPTEANGTVEVPFTFDASDLAGKTVVAFETISTEGVTFGVHADIEDEDQTVRFVKLGTTALTKDDLHEMQVPEDGLVTITDTVFYENLIPGTEYKVSGTLHKQIVNVDGTVSDGGALLGEDGKELVVEQTFTPKEENGTVEMVFTFSASELSGQTVVAFETLSKGDLVIAGHTDIADEEQSIHFTELHTTALGTEGLHEIELPKGEDKTVTIVDRVEYKNLIPGTEYTLTGVLHKQEVNKKGDITDGGILTDTEQTMTFVPETANGFVDMTFTVDAGELSGATLVAFETLTKNGITVGTHTDITDEAQTVRLVEIHTTALGENGSHMTQVTANGKVTITDRVAYTNLTPGKTYTMEGTLHLKEWTDQGEVIDGGVIAKTNEADGTAAPNETEADVPDTEADMPDDTEVPDGTEADVTEGTETEAAELTARAVFVPNQPDGSVDITFTFDASELAGKTVVAFERLTLDGKLAASHEDIHDEDQSVHFVKLRTKALAENGEHEMTLPEGENRTVTITDLVEYKNLIPGLEYKVKGEVHVQSTDGNGQVTDMGILANADGSPVSAETTFVPDAADGSVELSFTMATTGLGKRTVVVFETLMQDDIVIATHADITDEHQSVRFEAKEQKPTPIVKPEPPREIVKTGEAPLYLAFIVLGIALMAGAGYVIFRKRRK